MEWLHVMNQKALAEAKRLLDLDLRTGEFNRFQADPFGFCNQVLHENFTDPIISVMESVRDNPVTIARSGNGVGKSHSAARIALWWFLVFRDAKVYITAAPPLENLKRILWGEIMSVVERHPEFFKGMKVRSLKIQRDATSTIEGVAIPQSGSSEEREAKFSGKHSPHLLFIVDEGDAVPDEVYKGIESCMSGGMARLLILFNPRAQYGPVYIKERDKQAKVIELSALDHPNVKEDKDIIPGAVTSNITVRRYNTWTRALAANEPFNANCVHVPEFLIGRTSVGLDGTEYPPLSNTPRYVLDPAFYYMVLGRYPPQSESQLISDTWINEARKRWDDYVLMHGEAPPEIVQPTMGLDVAEKGGDWNICCLKYGSFIARMIPWQGLDIDETAMKALAIYHEKNCAIAMIDGMGIGSAVAPFMARKGREDDVAAISVKVSEKPSIMIKAEQGEFRALRDQLWWAVREWLRTDKNAMLPPEPLLVEELKTPTYRVNPDNGKIEVMGKDKMRDLLKRSPDRADALCLAFTPIHRPKFIRLSVKF